MTTRELRRDDHCISHLEPGCSPEFCNGHRAAAPFCGGPDSLSLCSLERLGHAAGLIVCCSCAVPVRVGQSSLGRARTAIGIRAL